MQSQARTFSVIFHVRKASAEEEKLPIYARVTINGKQMEQSMKQRINPLDWNENRGMAKPKSEDFKVLPFDLLVLLVSCVSRRKQYDEDPIFNANDYSPLLLCLRCTLA